MDYELEVREYLMTLLRDEYISSKKQLNGNERIYHDLGITGDDAYELLIAVKARYPFDVREFDFLDYFDGEGLPLPGARLLGLPNNGPKIKKPLTIDHLVKICTAQKWIDPE